MKKLLFFLFIAAITINLSAATTPTVSEKAIKNFKAAFTEAREVLWSEENGMYTVRFTLNNIRTRVMYSEDGDFLSSHRYYTEEYLPTDIVCKLKKKFPTRKIFGVVEYVIGDDINYYVKMEDEKTWITVKVDNYRTTEVTEKYQKG
jgi:hypothetical protein